MARTSEASQIRRIQQQRGRGLQGQYGWRMDQRSRCRRLQEQRPARDRRTAQQAQMQPRRPGQRAGRSGQKMRQIHRSIGRVGTLRTWVESIQQIAVRHALARWPVTGHVGLHASRNAEQGGDQLPCPTAVQADGRSLAERAKQLSGAIIQNGINAQQPVGQCAPGRRRGSGVQTRQPPQGGPGFRMRLDGQPPAMGLQQTVQIGQPHTGLDLDHAACTVEAGSAGEMGGGVNLQTAS